MIQYGEGFSGERCQLQGIISNRYSKWSFQIPSATVPFRIREDLQGSWNLKRPVRKLPQCLTWMLDFIPPLGLRDAYRLGFHTWPKNWTDKLLPRQCMVSSSIFYSFKCLKMWLILLYYQQWVRRGRWRGSASEEGPWAVLHSDNQLVISASAASFPPLPQEWAAK